MAKETTVNLGPTGKAVCANVKRWRDEKNLTYAELARRLERIGRSIPVLGLRRIESEDRRVDADDLVALALAFEVAPITLLMPGMPRAADRHAKVAVTGVKGRVSAEKLWLWLAAENPLTEMSVWTFMVNAQPEWRHAQWDQRG